MSLLHTHMKPYLPSPITAVCGLTLLHTRVEQHRMCVSEVLKPLPLCDRTRPSLLFCAGRSGSSCLFLSFSAAMGSTVLDLLYWRECRRSGLVFGGLQLLLLCLTQFSVVSVCAYIALATLSTTISFRIYKSILQAVQKSDEGHPFKSYLEVDVALTPAQMSAGVEKIQLYATCLLKELRRLFLVQDLVDSVKFAVLMWLPTYVGALFNGLTLLILALVAVFTCPMVYEKYQTQIDQYLGVVRTHVSLVVGKIKEKVPGAKRKEE
ncbi:reticulon-1-A-like isoform X2 [Denticeps clupeoides]|uniref:reticulon-1-A-like isoform X2 n=1 Tax=Denticeps clupeoides TaxID=299321 RepID=UPI0010A3CB9F|nr:reticulon-1-A-like isoform X2 [Denticeps clupeoides]